MRSALRVSRLWVGLLVVVAVGLAGVGGASADREKVHLTAAGQAAARAVVVRRGDLGTAGQWTGGARKPDLSSTMPCAGYQPKQSDLVLIGAAKTVWKSTGIQFDSEAQACKKSDRQHRRVPLRARVLERSTSIPRD
jgi:hypothetical protein